MNDSTHDDDFQDHIQRLINEHKRQELNDKYGANFSSESNPQMPPEMESEWLDHIDEFERQFENAEQISLRQFIKSPTIRSLDQIPPPEVENELNHLVDILANYGIVVDFLYDVEPTEAYRFISEELLEEEIDDISIPGMRCHFIYEEFYPNDEEDVKGWAQEFLEAFLGNDEKGLIFTLKEDKSVDPDKTNPSPQQMVEMMEKFHALHENISDVKIEPLRSEVEEDNSEVELDLSWGGKAAKPTVARATIYLERNPYGGWDVIRAEMPGLV